MECLKMAFGWPLPLFWSVQQKKGFFYGFCSGDPPQVEDADFPEEEDMDGDISDDSQESVSLLAEAKKHRYM